MSPPETADKSVGLHLPGTIGQFPYPETRHIDPPTLEFTRRDAQTGELLFPRKQLWAAIQRAREAIKPVVRDLRHREGYSTASAEAIFDEARTALFVEGVLVRPSGVVPCHGPGRRLWIVRSFQLVHIDSGEQERDTFPWPLDYSAGRGDAYATALTRSYRYYLRDLLLISQAEPVSGETVEATSPVHNGGSPSAAETRAYDVFGQIADSRPDLMDRVADRYDAAQNDEQLDAFTREAHALLAESNSKEGKDALTNRPAGAETQPGGMTTPLAKNPAGPAGEPEGEVVVDTVDPEGRAPNTDDNDWDEFDEGEELPVSSLRSTATAQGAEKDLGF